MKTVDFIKKTLGKSFFSYIPVSVRSGIAKRARWTILPYSAYWRGNFEPEVQRVTLEHGCRPGMVCWDLGAHFGLYSVGMAMHVGKEGEVVSFEPDPVSFQRFLRHVMMNKLENIKAYNAAASNTDGTGEILIYEEGLGATTTHLAYPDEKVDKCPKKIMIPLFRIDSLVAKGEIRLPDFIKIDVEGHGASALKGAEKSIASSKPVILISFHGSHEIERTRRILDPLGYSCFSLNETHLDWSMIKNEACLLKRK